MNKKETIQTIENLIENRYAETHVGYHADYRHWNHNQGFQRGCYAQIADAFDSTIRIYERSYAELLISVQQYCESLDTGSERSYIFAAIE